MGLFTIFRKKKDTPTPKVDQDESDLEKEIRQLKRQRKLQEEKFLLAEQKAEFEDLMEDLYGSDDDGDDPDSILTTLLMKVFNVDNITQTLTQTSSAPPLVMNPTETDPQRGADLTPEQLADYWQKLDHKSKKLIKRLNDESLKKAIALELPDATPRSQEMAFAFIKAQ